jgi:hypothetical protein
MNIWLPYLHPFHRGLPLVSPPRQNQVKIQNIGRDLTFNFDRIFGEDSTQEQVRDT